MSTPAYRPHTVRTATHPRSPTLHTATITAVSSPAPHLRLITLTPHTRTHFSPGQWVDLHLPTVASAGGFTIISPPTDPRLQLSVRSCPANPAAAWVWGDGVLGAQVQLRIGGAFVADGRGVDRLVLVAGGVGVNPFLSMSAWIAGKKRGAAAAAAVDRSRWFECVDDVPADVAVREEEEVDARRRRREREFECVGEHIDSVPDEAPSSPPPPPPEKVDWNKIDVKLLWGGKAGEWAFLDRLERDVGRENMQLFETGEADGTGPEGWDVAKRRMTVEDVAKVVDGREGRVRVFVCGPKGFTDEMVEGVSALGVPEERVLCERWW